MKIKEEIKDNPSSTKRVRYLRSMLGVSRTYISKKYDIPEITLKYWETTASALSKKALHTILEVYAREGIIASEEWIMKGEGFEPKIISEIENYFSTPLETEIIEDENLCMIRDANLFKSLYKDSVTLAVYGNAMSPYYLPGDYVGGKWRYGNAIQNLSGRDCVIKSLEGDLLFRRLILTQDGKYNLSCLNPYDIIIQPVIFNVNIECAAPVIWHRKYDK